jgi:VWFA-related protein
MGLRPAAVAAALAAVWTAGPFAAQNVQPPTTFRAGTDLVEVDVVVHGKDGAFVGDLSAADFIVEENGRAQPIQQFYLHLSNGSRSVTAQSTPPGAAVAGGADVQTPAPRVFVVVFDDEHLTPSGFKRTQAAAESLFSRQFRNGDIGGVVTRGRMAGDRLTTEREDLLRAVKDARPNANKNSRLFDERQWPRLTEIEAVRIVFNNDRIVLEEAIRRACADDPDLCKRVDPEPPVRAKASQMGEVARAESARTLQMLSTLTKGLANLPGRKTILLMSEGFLTEDEWPLVNETVSLAARANARIYTLDARGLERGLTSVFDVTASDSSTRLLEQMDFGGDSVNSLAVDTGGFVVRNTNQFDAAIARIADDAGNYYVLGIRPGGQPDAKFHPVRVKVNRPGVAVRARRGYIAVERPAVVQTATAPQLSESAAAAARRPDEDPAAATASVTDPTAAATAPEPAPVTPITGSVVRQPESSSGLRIRPDAELHANALGVNRARDADATAGWDAYQRGDVETARAKLADAAARNSTDAWVHYTLGMSNYALRRFKDAIASWERVRAAVPDFEPVYFDLVDAYLQEKEHDHATRIARAGLVRWPADPELANALGVVQTSRGALDDAVKSFQSAIAVAPGDATGYFNLAKALELRYTRSRRYVQQLRAWVAHEPDRAAAIQNYERYIELGGVYADSARAGLTRLKWMPGSSERR